MNAVQPFVDLSAANARSMLSFASSPEIMQISSSTFLQCWETYRTAYGRMVASSAFPALMRSMMENYAAFGSQMVGLASGAAMSGTRQFSATMREVTTLPDAAKAAQLVN